MEMGDRKAGVTCSIHCPQRPTRHVHALHPHLRRHITGSLPRKKDNPAVPITVSEQVESTHAAFEAGASLVHLHVRNDDETPSSSPDRFARVLEGIRWHCPGIITQVSTGGRSGAGRERGAMLQLKPDMASLATGSVNFPTRVYDNSPDLVDWLAAEMKAHGVKPEVEAFDLSMIFQAAAMHADGRIPDPLHVQFVMGIKNAMPVDREVFEFYVRDPGSSSAPEIDLDRRRHRTRAAHADQVVAGAGRPLPHRPRRQRAPRPAYAGAVQRGSGGASGSSLRGTRPQRCDASRSSRAAAPGAAGRPRPRPATR